MTRKGSGRTRASGRFVLRIDPGLHDALRRSAAALGVSLNDYCARKLAVPGGAGFALSGAADVIARGTEQFGSAMVGVIAHGSWVRGEAVDGSDVDVLIVVDREVRLTRSLYRAWDASPVTLANRPVEPHIVRMPESGQPVTSLWAEVAVDGLVLFERGLELSMVLTRVRQAIAAGTLVRRVAHGQPYWTEVA